MSAHIVWDWNGTLLHDIDAVVEATNASLRALALPPLTRDEYRRRFCQPVTVFYERLAGRAISEAEWLELDRAYYATYHAELARCGLADGAAGLLDEWLRGGGSQSLLSLYPHEWLLPLVERYGIHHLFVRLDGGDATRPGPKAAHLVRHLAGLGLRPEQVVLVGDSPDDAAAAAHVGARCVLHAGGLYHPDSLAGVGVPVAHTLAEAVEMVLDDRLAS